MKQLTRITTQISLLLLISLALLTTAFANAPPKYSTYITSGTDNNIPRDEASENFDCSDKIYVVVEVASPLADGPSEHLLIVKWFNPGNKLDEKTKYAFTSYGEGTRFWAWLRLSAGAGAAIGRIFDPAFGMGEFIGQWRAEIWIDDQKISSHPFHVLC